MSCTTASDHNVSRLKSVSVVVGTVEDAVSSWCLKQKLKDYGGVCYGLWLDGDQNQGSDGSSEPDCSNGAPLRRPNPSRAEVYGMGLDV